MDVSMTAKFKILALKNGKYETFTEIADLSLSVGEFWFLIDGKDVHFDFDNYLLSEREDGVFTYGSDYDVSDYYTEDLSNIGLSYSDLTPSFLSSVSEIRDFHLNFLIEENGKEKEIDIGDADENILPDSPFKIELLDLYFDGEEDEKEYRVKEEVLQKFNRK